MLITSSIPNLINGVSQQPPTLRLSSQGEEQVNFRSSVATGLTVRPPTRHLAKLSGDRWDSTFLHTINRDVSERYVVAIKQNELRVFEAETGIERTVNAPDGFGYLGAASKTAYRAVTVADYTFILNRNKKTATLSDTSQARPNKALVVVKGSNFGRNYRIYINDVERASYTTPDGNEPWHGGQAATNVIATNLYDDLVASGLTGYTFTRSGDVIEIERTSAASFTVRVEDGSGGVNILAVQSQIQRFSDLPKEAPNGFVVKIVGDQASKFDNYYMKFATEGGAGIGAGVWEETLAGGERYKFDPDTMPHVLVREANGEFTFKTAEWEPRKVGDLENIPHPSFVGRPIKDIFFFLNRLGFLADENVVMSQDGEFFDFFRSTATTTLDTDPIDIAVTADRVSILNFAVPFNKTLLLFSDQSQFILEGGEVLTANTVAVAQSTAFESLPNVRPVGVGQFVYFPIPRGGHTGIREYFVMEGGEQNDALDVTSHVPRYIPRGLFRLSASSAEDMLIGLSTVSPNSLWVYSFFFNQEGKLQSAWSEWRMSAEDTILSAEFIESRLYLIISREDGTYLESISLEIGAADADSTILYRVDRGVLGEDCSPVFDGTSTTFTLPYTTNDTLYVVVRGTDPDYPEGLVVPHSKTSGTTVEVAGDWTLSKLVIGQKYQALYVFSTMFMKSPEPGGGMSSNSDGRLQLRYLAVDYADAGYFRLVSQPRGRQRTERVFSGRVLGVESGTIGAFNLSTGRFRIPVMSRNVDAYLAIEADSPLPASFTSAEWEATYTTRARKV